MAIYLTLKEIWRGRGRFLVFNLVIALITMLVLFVAALGSGLANANRQFIDKIDADLLAVQSNTDLSLTASRIGEESLDDIRQIDGVEAAGPLGLSAASLVINDDEKIDVSLIGVEPGEVGAPQILSGASLDSENSLEIIIDEQLAEKHEYQVGDEITLRTVQGTEEEFFTLTIVGLTTEQQYFFQPSVFVGLSNWDEIKPQPFVSEFETPLIFNTIALQLEDGASAETVIGLVADNIEKLEASDKESIIRAQPGYLEQQNTINAQGGFALVIGMLVLGGFFQIQTLQKVPQIGMLKAIGASNRTVAASVFTQVMLVTLVGISLGTALTFGLALGIPSNVPIRFTPEAVGFALAALFAIAPLGGIFSIRMATKVEPLIAMGL